MENIIPLDFSFKKFKIVGYGLLLFFLSNWKKNRFIDRWEKKVYSKIGTYLDWDIKITLLRRIKWKQISAKYISIRFPNRTTLVIENVSVLISLRDIFNGNLIKSIDSDNIWCKSFSSDREADSTTYVKMEEFPFKFIRKKYYYQAFNILDGSIRFCPPIVNIKNIELASARRPETTITKMSRVLLQDGSFTMEISSPHFGEKVMVIYGRLNKYKRWISLDNIVSTEPSNTTSGIHINNTDNKFVKITIQIVSNMSMKLRLSLKDIPFYCRKLFEEKIMIKKLEANIGLSLSKDSLQFSKDSVIKYNDLCLSIYVCHYFPDMAQITLQCKNIPMDSIFNSYSHFKYRPLYDLKFLGELSNLTISFASEVYSPYKHYFEHCISWDDIKLLNTSSNWPDLDNPFIHKIYKDGILIRSVFLSIENSNFIKFEEIPKMIKKIIQFTEDPDFYKHTGVDDASIGHAIIQNILTKKIRRGGSTITMQLVRNLFLGHKRIINRKVEEILISLLIENVFKISKNRILELYFNIIEFAPGIYGIKEACKFYFSKLPCELSITEILVLSYIIPRPKYFFKSVSSLSEQLKMNLKHRIQSLSIALAKKNIITEKNFESINMEVCIRGVEFNLRN